MSVLNDNYPGFKYYYGFWNVNYPTTEYFPLIASTITGLTLLNTYYIYIRVEDSTGTILGETVRSAGLQLTIPTPSKPTLNLISGSRTTLLLGNVVSLSGYTYYYRLNTHPVGQYTAILSLIPSENGYIVPGLLPNQDYRISIVIGDGSVYGSESLYSDTIKIVISISTPTLSPIAGTRTSLLIGNIDNYPGYTYYYSTNGSNYFPVPVSYTITGLTAGENYSVYIQARDTASGSILGVSAVSNIVDGGKKIFSWASNPIPSTGFTLTTPMYLACNLLGGQGGGGYYDQTYNGFSPGATGASISIASVLLPVGLTLFVSEPHGGASISVPGDACILTIKSGSVTQAVIVAGGGSGYTIYTGPGSQGSPGTGSISTDLLGITPYTSITNGQYPIGIIYNAIGNPGGYTMTLIPA
jgi:hypothetical protein